MVLFLEERTRAQKENQVRARGYPPQILEVAEDRRRGRSVSSQGAQNRFARVDNRRVLDAQRARYSLLTEETFIFTDLQVKDGILLEFVDPLEDSNHEYLVNWSESLITIEKVNNTRKYQDAKLDNYEKYCTLPQMSKWCTTSTVSSNLLKEVFSKVTNMMAEHISSFFRKAIRVKFMNLIFKVDKKKTVYFLYCRRLQCVPESDAVINMINEDNETIVEAVPNFVMNTVSAVSHKPRPIRLINKCTSCGKNTSSHA